MTGNNNTFLGAYSEASTGTLTNATAIGAYAEVAASNAMVLGSIKGVNNATASTNVGIGTTAPAYMLHVGDGNNGFRVEGPAPGSNSPVLASFGGSGNFSIDAVGFPQGRFVVKDGTGYVGIGTGSPDSLLSVNGNADKPGGGSWGTFSDRRLKDLDGSFNAGLSQILKINPVRYRYKADNAMGIRDQGEHVGLVAQEVQKVIPEAVTENDKGYLLVNNDPILWTMLNAIKEQQGLIRKQQEQIRAQQAKMKAQETRIDEQQAQMKSSVKLVETQQAQIASQAARMEAQQKESRLQQAQIAELMSQVKAIQASLKTNGRAGSEIRTVKAQVPMVQQ